MKHELIQISPTLYKLNDDYICRGKFGWRINNKGPHYKTVMTAILRCIRLS